MPTTDVVVIGGGQAGLAMSAVLTRAGVDHVVLEREAALGGGWRQRWDSFTLVTPNWTIRLPGAPYSGPEPDGFLPRDEIVDYLEGFAVSFDAPVVTGIEATEVTQAPASGYRVQTSNGPYDAGHVVVATGTFRNPRRPAIGRPDPAVFELHSSAYRNPDGLPPGGVLVVGSGQSGCQIAEELHEAGRDVHLATGRAGRIPRRYRGRDVFRWAEDLGILDKPVEALDSPAERFEANPHVSGKNGGHTINLHRLAREGVHLTGRLAAIDGRTVTFTNDRRSNLELADATAEGLRSGIDAFVAAEGVDAPAPDPADDDHAIDGFEQPEIERLDLAGAGVSTILWSSGYAWDFSWVRPARLDDAGYPIQPADASARQGLHFLGLHFLHRQSSALLYGVGQEAEAIGAAITGAPPD